MQYDNISVNIYMEVCIGNIISILFPPRLYYVFTEPWHIKQIMYEWVILLVYIIYTYVHSLRDKN